MNPSRLLLLAAIGGLAASSGAWAAAGGPLPRCDKSTASFYLMRYIEATTANTAPKTVLSQATVPTSGAVALTTIWDGATAPTPSPRDLSSASGATVAGGMGNDGYIYAMRAVGAQEPGWDLEGGVWTNEWRTHTRHYEMLRYGRDGVDNLGIVAGLGTFRTVATDSTTETSGAVDQRLGPNFNAADVDPKTGVFYLANFQTGGALNRVHRIDVTTTPPQYLDTLTLSGNIPGAQSGDFAIDASGEWAYGVATTGNILTGTSVAYRFNLASGTVETLAGGWGAIPRGAAARLLNNDNQMAFYGGLNTRLMNLPGGTLGSSHSTSFADSADAAACLPKLEVTLACTPAELFDSPANVATCTLTLDAPAPVGGLAVALDTIAADPRYGTTCTSPQTIAEGETGTTCTVTATPNTVVGDGDVPVTVALSAPGAQDDYVLGTPTSAELLVRDDDVVPPGPGAEPTPVPVDAPWMLGLLGALLAGSGALRRRVRHGQR